MKEVLAWYFARPNEKLGYGDARNVAVGTIHEVDATPILCKSGLHGSVKVLDALSYAMSPILYRVKISGHVVHGENKLCGQRREYIARYNVEDILCEFSRKQALFHISKLKPYCSEADYSLVVKWLESGDESLRDSAGYAACCAVEFARSVDSGTAWSASRVNSWYGSRGIAFVAREDWAVANNMLTKMIEEM